MILLWKLEFSSTTKIVEKTSENGWWDTTNLALKKMQCNASLTLFFSFVFILDIYFSNKDLVIINLNVVLQEKIYCNFS